MSKKKVKPNKQPRRLLFWIVLAVLLFTVAATGYRLVELKMEAARAKANLKALIEERARLQEDLQSIDSDDYVEKKAREELKMIFPDEVLYVILNNESTRKTDGGDGKQTQNP